MERHTADAAVPPDAVLTAFGCQTRPVQLPGGEGRSWRTGDVVLKPTGDAAQSAWIADVLSAVRTTDVIVPRPIRAGNGTWVVDGWTAMEFVEARAVPRRWPEILSAGRAFHAALARVARPAWLEQADDWWRRADQVAWGTRPAVGAPELVALVERLRRLRQPLFAREQVIHADLCGNVLFTARGHAVVIDFSPYWRPVEWASAVVAIDAYEWEEAGVEALHWIDDVPEATQLLVRAGIFRIATSAEVAAARGLDDRKLRVHGATVEVLEGRCAPR